MSEMYDVIVIGAGSAGCALAERLTADSVTRVLLIEAGGSDRRATIRMPIGYGRAFVDPAVNWRYRTRPDPGLGGREIYWPRGKVLGGSSSINAMVYCRGLPADYDDWRDAGNPGWGWSDVAPVFQSLERHVSSKGPTGGDGALWVSNREAEYHPLKKVFYAAAQQAGFPVLADLNGELVDGIGPYAINTRRGLRCSSADAFLRPALGRRNLDLMMETKVDRIQLENRRAVGVIISDRRGPRVVHAHREIVLAAGAIGSPLILQRSGIGPARLLRDNGIDVIHDSPAVGAGLQDHVGVNYFYRSRVPTLNSALGTWPGRIRSALQFLANRSGPLSMSVNQIGGLVRSSPLALRPDIQLYLNPISYSTEYRGRRVLLRPDPYPGFIMSFNSCRPTSRGRVTISSPHADAEPVIEPAYLSTEKDILDVLAGARVLGRLQETAAMRAVLSRDPEFDLARASDEAIIADFRRRASTVFHPCGTCRMAPQRDGGVVDPDLAVYGIKGLRVADASVFPHITSANTHAPAVLVGHMAARAMQKAGR
ncbi:MAG: GMC family oxidoreductase N-terminal domain-containing protein [Hyphomicrobiales bacterium]|nr:GMC family oxidoreductase N-terminal domain-containing protein [Hyphomicrobiales bacterium]